MWRSTGQTRFWNRGNSFLFRETTFLSCFQKESSDNCEFQDVVYLVRRACWSAEYWQSQWPSLGAKPCSVSLGFVLNSAIAFTMILNRFLDIGEGAGGVWGDLRINWTCSSAIFVAYSSNGIFKTTFGLFHKPNRKSSLVEMPGLNVCKVWV